MITQVRQHTILQSNLVKIKYHAKLEATDIHLAGLGKKSLRPTGYLKAEIKIHDSKFETAIFAINDNFIGFDTIINTCISR